MEHKKISDARTLKMRETLTSVRLPLFKPENKAAQVIQPSINDFPQYFSNNTKSNVMSLQPSGATPQQSLVGEILPILKCEPLKADRLLGLKEVISILSVSRSTIYNWLDTTSSYKRPDFPIPIQLSMRRIAWRESEIMAFLKKLK